MNRKLIIIGAGGHGKVAADIAELNGYSVNFLDDSKSKCERVIGKTSDFEKYIDDYDFFIAIGNNALRKKFFDELELKMANIITLVHPNAVVSKNVQIDKGSVVMAGAVVNVGSKIGKGCIVNTGSSVDHDCIISDFVHISVGSHLAGNVKIGTESFICAGAIVINNIVVSQNVTVGAGAVVINNILESGTYVGVPAVEK